MDIQEILSTNNSQCQMSELDIIFVRTRSVLWKLYQAFFCSELITIIGWNLFETYYEQ